MKLFWNNEYKLVCVDEYSDEISKKPKLGFKFDEIFYEDASELFFKTIGNEQIDLTDNEKKKVVKFVDGYDYPDITTTGVDENGKWLGMKLSKDIFKEVLFHPPNQFTDDWRYDFETETWKDDRSLQRSINDACDMIDKISTSRSKIENDKSTIHSEKYNQAKTYLETKRAKLSDYPLVKLDTKLFKTTGSEAATNIVKKHDEWINSIVTSEDQRISAKNKIRKCKTKNDIEKILEDF